MVERDGYGKEIDHLREMVEQQVEFHKREHELIREGMEEFKKTLDLRLAGMNEFRKEMEKAERDFLRRDTYEHYHESIVERVSGLEKSQWMIAGGIGVIVVGIEIMMRLLK
jgi:CRISPR/Cas system-associated exonuclease Cas4 (RecB family)